MKNKRIYQQIDEELYRLSKGFNALNIAHKKGVLRTAQGLLQIQRTHKEMIAAGAEYSAFSAQ